MADYSKKMVATLTRELRKIKRNLEGIRKMSKLPGALVLIDVKREHIAAREARKLGIPVVGLIDTDSDPDVVDIAIPGNDDAMRAIELLLESMGDSIMEGMRARPKEEPKAADAAAGRGPRRPTRVAARADEPAAVEAPAAEPAAAPAVHAAAAAEPEAAPATNE